MPNELGVSLILNSLNKDYDQFVQNYNMHSMGKTIVELHAMLKFHKKAKDSICHHYKEVGYWRRNYPSYQAELKKRKEAFMASTSGS
nr:zinc finger, CCHC-type [Tanacetum cinerariifolium]